MSAEKSRDNRKNLMDHDVLPDCSGVSSGPGSTAFIFNLDSISKSTNSFEEIMVAVSDGVALPLRYHSGATGRLTVNPPT
jgi:hypothetical protein